MDIRTGTLSRMVMTILEASNVNNSTDKVAYKGKKYVGQQARNWLDERNYTSNYPGHKDDSVLVPNQNPKKIMRLAAFGAWDMLERFKQKEDQDGCTVSFKDELTAAGPRSQERWSAQCLLKLDYISFGSLRCFLKLLREAGAKFDEVELLPIARELWNSLEHWDMAGNYIICNDLAMYNMNFGEFGPWLYWLQNNIRAQTLYLEFETFADNLTKDVIDPLLRLLYDPPSDCEKLDSNPTRVLQSIVNMYRNLETLKPVAKEVHIRPCPDGDSFHQSINSSDIQYENFSSARWIEHKYKLIAGKTERYNISFFFCNYRANSCTLSIYLKPVNV